MRETKLSCFRRHRGCPRRRGDGFSPTLPRAQATRKPAGGENDPELDSETPRMWGTGFCLGERTLFFVEHKNIF